MNIAGFQPLSLIDFPGKSSAIVFAQGCVFRCPYCHNPELIPVKAGSGMPEDEIIAYLKKYKPMLDGVVITGGEPTIQFGLLPFIVRLKELGYAIKLDTNGIHPLFVQSLIEEKMVDYVAMDLKHRWEKYEEVARTNSSRTTAQCKQTFDILQRSGVEHEFRTTVCPGIHAEEDISEMASYLRPGEKYFLQATQFKKNLESDLDRALGFDLNAVVTALRVRHPDVEFGVR